MSAFEMRLEDPPEPKFRARAAKRRYAGSKWAPARAFALAAGGKWCLIAECGGSYPERKRFGVAALSALTAYRFEFKSVTVGTVLKCYARSVPGEQHT